MAAFLFMIKGEKIILRACEPQDIDHLYEWENDMSVWHVTNTYIPFSKHTLQKYLESIQDIYTDRQLRLLIVADGKPVGMIDLFDFEPYHLRAGVGILIAQQNDRHNGLATDALNTLKTYCRDVLGIRILFCNILVNNTPSLKLFEKCGFQLCGTKPAWHRSGDVMVDEHFFQVIL